MSTDFLKSEVKKKVESIIEIMKSDLRKKPNDMPLPFGGFFIHNTLDNTVIPAPILNFYELLQSNEAKKELKSVVQAAGKIAKGNLPAGQKIFSFAQIIESWYYTKPVNDPTPALPASYYPDRKEGLISLIYFEDSLIQITVPYLRGVSKMMFEPSIIMELNRSQINMKGTISNLFPFE